MMSRRVADATPNEAVTIATGCVYGLGALVGSHVRR
jgi:hypothetical protein